MRIGVKAQPFKSEVEELQSLDQGRIKYVVEDDVIFTVFQKENPNSNIEALTSIATPDDIIYGGGYGYARYGIRKEDCQLRVAYSRRPGRAARQRLRQRGAEEVRPQRPQPLLVQAQPLR